MVSLSKKLRTFAGPYVKGFVARHGYRLVSDYRAYQSETSKCRERLAPFCIGYGADLGFGGDPISDGVVRVDYPNPYRSVDMALRGQMKNRRGPIVLKNCIHGGTITDVRLLEGISAVVCHEI
jgi:hypothetical protein